MLRAHPLALLALLALSTPAATASGHHDSRTLRVMAYCDGFSTVPDGIPTCGGSVREEYAAHCPFQTGPCLYTPLDEDGVGVGFIVLLPEGYDRHLCTHPFDCYGVALTLDPDSPLCSVIAKAERPGNDVEVPTPCTDPLLL